MLGKWKGFCMKFLIYDRGRHVPGAYPGSLRSYPMTFMHLAVIARYLQLPCPVLLASEIGLILL